MKEQKNLKKEEPIQGFPIPRENYIYLAIGFVTIVIGFLMMIGGKSDNPDVFNYEIFSFRRITLAPIVVITGFIFEIYAIMRKPKEA